jgi:hypothetical protein
MNAKNKITLAIAAIALLWTTIPIHAASAAGAAIERNGKEVGGYAVTLDGQSRADLAWALTKQPITFGRDFVIPVDAKDPASATLQGKIEIVTKVAGERKVMATATSLKLVQREGHWHVQADSLEKVLCSCKIIAKKCTLPNCGATTDEEHDMLNHVAKWVRVHEKACPLAGTSEQE